MGNKKNERKRKPTAKKMAEKGSDSESPPPRHTSTRPKPKPTYKGTENSKSAYTEASDTFTGADKVTQASDFIAQTSNKAAKDHQSVTWADSDVSMVYDDAGEDEIIEEDVTLDDSDELLDEEDDEVLEEVKSHRRKASSAPGMCNVSYKIRLKPHIYL